MKPHSATTQRRCWFVRSPQRRVMTTAPTEDALTTPCLVGDHERVTVPERPALEGLESTWDAVWQRDGIFRFDRSAPRDRVYAIDTPPPTVSGQLHIGTVFGYVQVDAIARFQRMRGREVFYPMGWDDNGLPTERRVQNMFGVQCDPDRTVRTRSRCTSRAAADGRSPGAISWSCVSGRRRRTSESFESVFRSVGLSVDWSLVYTTIDERSRRTAQRGFLRNLARGEAYAAEAPTLWDVDFRTAIAQAELEDRPVTGTAVRLAFSGQDGAVVEVETTRPELLPACVALVVPPDDERFAALFGTSVRTPLFEVAVPVLEHPLADRDKGTGIAMVCTFGDTTDVVWWRELRLPLRVVLDRDGRFRTDAPEWLSGAARGVGGDRRQVRRPGSARPSSSARRGRCAARRAQPDRPRGQVLREGRPAAGDRHQPAVVHPQRISRRRPARVAAAGRPRSWAGTPSSCGVRYEHWVEGLNTDWLISRQRYFGVPFPLWYPVERRANPLGGTDRADERALPIDPQTEVPPGFQARSAVSRGASSVTPTSWTPGRRRR